MLTRQTMGGLYALPPTPFTPKGEFDEDAFRHNCRALIAAGVDAITITGSNGEFHTMTWDMLKGVIRVFVEECKGKVTAIAGCSAVHTEDAILRTRYAMELGADAVMNVSPYYIDLTFNELVTFWKDVATACPHIGIVIYNNPGTAQLHPYHVFKELAKLPNICGSKEGHGNFDLLTELLRDSDRTGLAYMTATEHTWFVPAMQLGSRGIFSMAAAVFPHHLVKLFKACKQGRWDDALTMQWRLSDAYHAMAGQPCMREYNMMARFKAMCSAGGILRCGKSRKPLITVSDEHQAMLNEFTRANCADLMKP